MTTEPMGEWIAESHERRECVAPGRPACPACGGSLEEIRGKLICRQCRTICETCCEGGRSG